MIVVSASTGEFGRLVIDRLLALLPSQELAIAVRNPQKAADLAERGVDVRYGDYDQPASLRAAFDGADRLLFISSPLGDLSGGRVAQHRAVVAAARQARVGHIAYTSGLGADMVKEGVLGEHHLTEQAIMESGLPYTLLRHPIYSDFFINPDLWSAVEAGELTSNTRGRGMNTATRADLAEAASTLLSNESPPRQVYNFTGLLWTYPELADTLSQVAGTTVRYREVDEDEGALSILGLAPVIQAGGFEVQTPDLEAALGHPPTSLQQAVAGALAARLPI